MGKRRSYTAKHFLSDNFISPKKFPSIPFLDNNEQIIGYAGCAMITRLKLKPGQKGTKKLAAEHGDALVCVRYRYDEARGLRIKTVELLVEQRAWKPPKRAFMDTDLVPVRIEFTDSAMRKQAGAAKGRWDPEQRLWLIRFGRIKGTELEKHIVLDAFPGRKK